MDNNKFGQIINNRKMNNVINNCFEFLSETEQKKFLNKFKQHSSSKIQTMHIFYELILGAYLSSNGFIVKYDFQIGSKKPDWVVFDTSCNTVAIIEMVCHHIDDKTNEIILNQIKRDEKIITYFPKTNDPELNRLYSKINKKANIYKNLVIENNVPYIIAVYIDYLAVIDVQETKICLTGGEDSLFKNNPNLSGVLQFEENNFGSYFFSFIENPFALRKILIPTGQFLKK